MPTIQSVCVYCASSPTIDEVYFNDTRELAQLLVQNGIEIVFGGGARGLMGCLADSVLEHGGKIKGIMPQFLNEVELAHRQVEEMEFTQNMHERKARFLEEVQGLIALPGGSGTLEELLEAITLKRLGQFLGPIVILNTANYYEPLKQMLEKSIQEGFMSSDSNDLWIFAETTQEVIDALMS